MRMIRSAWGFLDGFTFCPARVGFLVHLELIAGRWITERALKTLLAGGTVRLAESTERHVLNSAGSWPEETRGQ
jgi:hypothetical protein